jgi:hypothetical protein
VDMTHAADKQRGEPGVRQPAPSQQLWPIGALARAYLPWLIALAGALLALALSMIVTSEGGVAADVPGDQELTMGGIETVGQAMLIARPDLAGVAIRINTAGQQTEALSITARLRYAAGPPIDLVRQSAPLSAAEGGVLIVRWAPINPSRNPLTATESLTLILDFPELPASTGPSFVVRERVSGQGRLTIDGTAILDRDLAVAPLYQRRWADTLWPISAMAAGKPGPLGWPPLYPLLAYLYLVALGSGLAALWRARARA